MKQKKYYFQLTAETLRNARIHTLSRGYVWSVEVSSNKLESYSIKIIDQLDDAYTKDRPARMSIYSKTFFPYSKYFRWILSMKNQKNVE